MTECKWTPGPWNYKRSDAHHVCHGNTVCDATTVCNISEGQCGEANAHLIAGAPDLYEALRIHHEWSIENMPEYSPFGEERFAYEMTGRALAKARGETQ